MRVCVIVLITGYILAQRGIKVDKFKVVEKDNHLAVHCLTWSKERANAWIERYGDSKMFMDKTLTKSSFVVMENK